MKLLMTDLNFRKSFDVVNILIRNYPNLELIFTVNERGLGPKLRLWLVYLGKFRLLRKDTMENFERDLSAILEEYSSEEVVYIPIEEDTTVTFYDFISRNKPANLRYCLPSKESFSIGHDKRRFSAYCQEQRLPVPRELSASEVSTLQPFDFRPLIVKPRIGSGASGIRFCRKFENLDVIKRMDLEGCIVQELLNNSRDVIGAFYLFKDGRMTGFYGHRRIRTYPPTGGVTTYSRLSDNEDVKETGRRLLENLNWSGFAMVEFLYDDVEKKFKIIELNPRIWASFMLSEFSGNKFLINYINASLSLPMESTKPRSTAFIRWFFPFDLVNYFSSKGRIRNFWKLDLRNTCYINFTYATPYRAFMFFLTTILDPAKISKLFRKLGKA